MSFCWSLRDRKTHWPRSRKRLSGEIMILIAKTLQIIVRHGVNLSLASQLTKPLHSHFTTLRHTSSGDRKSLYVTGMRVTPPPPSGSLNTHWASLKIPSSLFVFASLLAASSLSALPPNRKPFASRDNLPLQSRQPLGRLMLCNLTRPPRRNPESFTTNMIHTLTNK